MSPLDLLHADGAVWPEDVTPLLPMHYPTEAQMHRSFQRHERAFLNLLLDDDDSVFDSFALDRGLTRGQEYDEVNDPDLRYTLDPRD